MNAIEIGLKSELTFVVKREHLASSYGSGLVDGLATPVLVGFCEECARTGVDRLLPTGQKTVGTAVSLDHLAPTPLGMTVTVTATLIGIDGRRLTFEIAARDEIEPIVRGTHERFIIDSDRFAAKVEEKAKRAGEHRIHTRSS